MQIAGISKLYYAADLDASDLALGDLPETARFPIGSLQLQTECGRAVGDRQKPAEQTLSGEAAEVIAAWSEKARSEQK